MSATYHKNTAKEKIHSESSFQPKFKTYLFLWVLFYIIKILSLKKRYIQRSVFFHYLHIFREAFIFRKKRTGTACHSLTPIPLAFSICVSLDLNTHFNQCK